MTVNTHNISYVLRYCQLNSIFIWFFTRIILPTWKWFLHLHHPKIRRDGWVAETSSLLNCRTRKGSGGSNPPLTAKGKNTRPKGKNKKRRSLELAHKWSFILFVSAAGRACFSLLSPPTGDHRAKWGNPLMINCLRRSVAQILKWVAWVLFTR